MNDLLALLNTLEGNEWATIEELAHRLSWPRRQVEAAIEQARLDGHAIIGGAHGVRLSTDAAEIRAYARDRRSRLVSIARGTRQLLRTARRLDASQPSLWG